MSAEELEEAKKRAVSTQAKKVNVLSQSSPGFQEWMWIFFPFFF